VSCAEGVVDVRPHVPEGLYRLSFQGYETRLMHGKVPKLVLHFRVCEPFEHHGVLLLRYNNVKNLIGKPGRNGKFRVYPGSDFAREYCVLYGHVGRLDRIVMARYAEQAIIGRVRTVTVNARQMALPEPLWHSVISELVRIA
jgi:hypothetical protein